MIAMALLLEPSLIIADEATSALDVTLQAQILELFAQVRDTHGTSILLVSHDLGVVAQTCDRVAVMYAGQVVESAPASHLFAGPGHPYTRALVATAPSYKDRQRALRGIPGRVPSLHEIPVGCSYAERCSHRHDDCAREPQLIQVSPHHDVRCVLYESDPAATVIHDAVAEEARSTTGEAARPPLVGSAPSPLLTARSVTKHFEARRSFLERIRRVAPQTIHAVDRVDLDLQRGEILGLVGESGSGKTTLAMPAPGISTPVGRSCAAAETELRSRGRRCV
jgi:peptide/nickel transport system ATP-binding protein